MLTPVEAGALEPLVPPPVQGLWEGLAGSAAPIDLGAPLSALVRPVAVLRAPMPRRPACPETPSHEEPGDMGAGHVSAQRHARQLPHVRLVVALLATCRPVRPPSSAVLMTRPPGSRAAALAPDRRLVRG